MITDASIAFAVARLAQEEGAQIVLTGFGRLTLVKRVAAKLPQEPPVVELDVADQEQLDSLADRVREHMDGVDGVLVCCRASDGQVDARVACPAYDWMGVAKDGLESPARYLARELGPRHIRVNMVAAGPVRTMAAKSIPGFDKFEDAWDGRAPLGWDNTDASPVARGVLGLLSDWFPATTGEMIHVDGGFHAMGV